MGRAILGITALCLSTARAAENPETQINFSDLPEVCRDQMHYFSSLAHNSAFWTYEIADTSSVTQKDAAVTYSYERRVWHEPRPSFADNLRTECRWTEAGNIYFSYEEPSPIHRPEDYYGQDSRLVDYRIFSPDGKTLVEEEIERALIFPGGINPY